MYAHSDGEAPIRACGGAFFTTGAGQSTPSLPVPIRGPTRAVCKTRKDCQLPVIRRFTSIRVLSGTLCALVLALLLACDSNSAPPTAVVLSPSTTPTTVPEASATAAVPPTTVPATATALPSDTPAPPATATAIVVVPIPTVTSAPPTA